MCIRDRFLGGTEHIPVVLGNIGGHGSCHGNTARPAQSLSLIHISVLVEQLEALPEVKHAFGRMYCPLPAEYQGKQGSIDLISYDSIQFGWAKKDLIGGTLPQEPEDGTYPVLTVFDKSLSLIHIYIAR